jgi:hypothetical protein
MEDTENEIKNEMERLKNYSLDPIIFEEVKAIFDLKKMQDQV